MSGNKSHRSNTLDRLQRFSFGSNRASSKDRDRKKESNETDSVPTTKSSGRSLSRIGGNSDKTERLRELTEKLKGLSPQGRSPTPKRPNRRFGPAASSTHIHAHQVFSDDIPRMLPPTPTNHAQSMLSPLQLKFTNAKSNSNLPHKVHHKSASFSQADLIVTENKFPRRKSVTNNTCNDNTKSDSRALTHPLGKRGFRSERHNSSSNLFKNTKKKIQPESTDEVSASNSLDLPEVVTELNYKYPESVSVSDKYVKCDGSEATLLNAADFRTDSSDNTNVDSLNDINASANINNINKLSRISRSSSTGNDRNGDKSLKRKGVYITKWPTEIQDPGCETRSDEMPTIYLDSISNEKNCTEVAETTAPMTAQTCWSSPQEEPYTPEEYPGWPEWPSDSDVRWNGKSDVENKIKNRSHLLVRVDSLSESESEHRDNIASSRPSIYSDKSDLSDCEGRSIVNSSPHPSRRYSKRPLRGPYGQMLEAEMKKPETNRMFSKLYYNKELKFLDDLIAPGCPTVNSSQNSLGSHESSSCQFETNRPNVVHSRGACNRSLDETQLNLKANDVASIAQNNLWSSPQRKTGAVNIPYTSSSPSSNNATTATLPPFIRHQRTTSSPSKLEGIASHTNTDLSSSEPTQNLRPTPHRDALETINLKNSSECLNIALFDDILNNTNDTRTHIVVELYDTERSYVESLQVLVMKYLHPLKTPENVGLLDPAIVDEIFYQVPALLAHHEMFLEELRKRLEHWDTKQKVGDIFIEAFTKPNIVETYTAFVNNWKNAKELIKSSAQAKPAFARFLEAMAREHKGKLALDSLLIKPIQKFPRYEMLIQRLLKNTDTSHPDHQLLLDAQLQIHDLLLKINCTERESTEFEQQQVNLKELECLIEGLINLVVDGRQYLRHDLVTMVTAQGTRKDRALFLFSDLLVITSIKRRSGTVRKPSSVCSASVANSLEPHKYKLLMRIQLDELEIVKAKDDNVRRVINEIENLSEDIGTLNQINELINNLHCPHEQLDEVMREMLSSMNRHLAERQNSGSQISYLELSLNTQNGIEIISILFPKNEIRTSWEDAFNEAKQKLALSPDRRPAPEFLSAVPIRKTRSGLQFTCAAPTLIPGNGTGGSLSSCGTSSNDTNVCRDVWVCNSDGYVGQVCVLSLYPEPTVISCNSVCNARILCMASIPSDISRNQSHSSKQNNYQNCKRGVRSSVGNSDEVGNNITFDSSSSSESENEDVNDDVNELTNVDSNEVLENFQPTMWLGTEDGCIHMYNCCDNIRIKKNKIKIQHSSAVQCIIYLDNKVFVSLANGDITIYTRDDSGSWNTTEPCIVSVGTASMPVIRMLPNNSKLWCGCSNMIKILNIHTLQVEHTFLLSNDGNKQLSCMTLSGLGIWLSMQNSAIVKCFHAITYELLCEVNVTPAVNKMLCSCDDIIRQHKSACLRVTALLACKELLWIGTSAGVVLTLLLPHVAPTTDKISTQLNVTGLPHGHTGQVRFLTYVEENQSNNNGVRYSMQGFKDQGKLLIISGGDGYEDFRNSSVSELAGREDSTNHLLLWHV